MLGYDWPRLHAMLNDLPAALLVTAVVFDLIALATKRVSFRQAGFFVLMAGAASLVLAASQIAHALSRHQAPVRVLVPHYAMSGGTLIALSADEIIMDPNAVLGPVDPQLSEYPAASVLAGGFSPRGKPVFGSIVMACMAMVSGEPVIGLAGGP